MFNNKYFNDLEIKFQDNILLKEKSKIHLKGMEGVIVGPRIPLLGGAFQI